MAINQDKMLSSKKGDYISSPSIVQILYINFLNYKYCITFSTLIQCNFCNKVLKINCQTGHRHF